MFRCSRVQKGKREFLRRSALHQIHTVVVSRSSNNRAIKVVKFHFSLFLVWVRNWKHCWRESDDID